MSGGSMYPATPSAVTLPSTADELLSFFELTMGYSYTTYRFFSTYTPHTTVLDFGCGQGLSTAYLSQHCINITGFDPDPSALAIAKNNIQPLFPNAHFTSTLPSTQFDIITSGDVLEHVQDPSTYLSTCHTILKPHGILLLSTPNGLISNHNQKLIKWRSPYHITEYTPKELQHLLDSSHFNILNTYSQFNSHTPLPLCVKRHLYLLTSSHLFTRQQLGNFPASHYTIEPSHISTITTSHCDTIIVVAERV